MQRPVSRVAAVAAFLILPALLPMSRAGSPGKVTIYRDSWGVPHIYGDSREAAAYGHGFAQAEDRLEDLLLAHLVGLGRAASVLGEDRLQADLVARMARHARLSRERYAELDPEMQDLLEYFVAGVRAFMRERPRAVPAWAVEPEPHHVVALYRAFSWAWPWGQARGDLRRAGSHVADGRGSNQWVVGASRTAGGSPIALIDPHLSWEPENRFYESHVHGGDLDFYGFSIIGTPLMAVGHTDVFSLALTTGGPDCADVYEEKIHPEDPLRYFYDGEWHRVDVEEIEIEVKTPGGGLRSKKHRIERTHHGPILERRENRAFAVRTGYDGEIGIGEQWLRMLEARDLEEFREALRANQTLPQNVMYADVHGELYYVRAGRVPVRPEGYRWDRPVPGWTSASEWRGLHDLDDLVQITNPSSGFMQNCNGSPATMMPRSPLTADRYPGVIYNSRPDRLNSRGRRALALLGAEPRLTLHRAREIAVDTYVEQAGPWQRALLSAFEAHREEFAFLRDAVQLLRKWDRRIHPGSRGAALFRSWMQVGRQSGSGVPVSEIGRGVALTRKDQRALLLALDVAVRAMREVGNRIDVRWGRLHRIGRGERSWPVGGLRGDGISTLRSVRFSEPDASGVSLASGGQLCTTVVVLKKDGVASFSATPFGQSNDPGSRHYLDQAEKLFRRGKLRPTWYARSDLMKHLESQRTLQVPEQE